MHILTKLELSRSSDCDADTMEASLFVMDSRSNLKLWQTQQPCIIINLFFSLNSHYNDLSTLLILLTDQTLWT